MREGSGYSFRAMFLIDSEGGVVAREVGDLPSGLGAREAKRLVMRHAGKTAVESLHMGMGGLALQEVGMAPKKSDEAMSEKRSYEEEVIGENKEDVKSNTSMDKVNRGFGGDNSGSLSAKKSSLVEGGKEKEVEVDRLKKEKKKRAPSICSCEYEFYHSRNLHQNTSM